VSGTGPDAPRSQAGEPAGVGRLVSSLGRRGPRPGRPAVGAALLLHAVLLSGLWYAHRQLIVQPADFRTYRVSLVSPPPAAEGPPAAAEAAPQIVQQPQQLDSRQQPQQQQQQTPPPRPAEQPRPQPPPPARPSTPPAQQPPTQQPQRTPPPTQRADSAPTATGNNPRPIEVAGDGVNVQQDGLEFPYPQYLQNIILQINRHFRWSGSPNLEARIHFVIRRDGTVGSINVVTRSGNFSFDVEAMRAVEQAGARRAFGPLPAGWQPDQLWISFKFLPPG
jgi:outer membrane biosynthesis protein TonB